MIKNNNKKGFALLFAVLTAGLMLTIGVSIFNISLKELLISGAARDSQLAFYAADSARECAMYWDLKMGAFKTCIGEGCPGKISEIYPGLPSISCANNTILLTDNYTQNNKTYTFSLPTALRFGDDTKPDASLTVIKEFRDNTKDIVTTISSQGHNTGPDNRRVERGIVQVFLP